MKPDQGEILLNMQANEEDQAMIFFVCQKIANIVRASQFPVGEHDFLAWCMDWTVVHCNGRELDLRRAMELQPEDLMADAVAIKTNIDRTTGKLPDFVRLHCDKKRGIIQ